MARRSSPAEPSRPARSSRRRRRGSAGRLASQLIGTVALTAAACSRTAPPKPTPLPDPARRLVLIPLTDAASRADVDPGQLCASSPERVLLDCGVRPVLPGAASICPAPKPDKGTDTTRPPCVLSGATRRGLFGWTLTIADDPARLKVLTVYVGSDRLRPVLRATDAVAPWAEVAVCPTDLNGDHRDDLLFVYREEASPERMSVEAVDIGTTPQVVAGLASLAAPTTQGEGCGAAIARQVRRDDRTGRLSLLKDETKGAG